MSMTPPRHKDTSSTSAVGPRSTATDKPPPPPPPAHDGSDGAGRAPTIRGQIWDGRIAVRFVVSQDEVRDFGSTAEHYISVPRIAYLPKYIGQALAHLKSALNRPDLAEQHDWWAEFEGSPVKWNWPVGLSYDLMTGLDPTKDADARAAHVPWTLILHHKNYPSEHVLAIQGPDTVRSFWMNQIKESSVVRTGNAKGIMNLSKEDTNALWQSIDEYARGNSIQFWKIFDAQFPMRASYPPELAAGGDASGVRHIPVKIYLPLSATVLQSQVAPYFEEPAGPAAGAATSIPDGGALGGSLLLSSTMMKRRILSATTGSALLESLHTGGGVPTTPIASGRLKIQTVGTALNARLPQLFPSKRTCILARPMVHGVELPLGAPLLELLRDALYPDGFLHVSIVMIS